MLLFADRNRKADEYPWLAWKVRAFVVGSVLAVFGMIQENRWLLGAATLVLLVGFLLRFLPGGKGVVLEEDPWATDDDRPD